MRVARAPGIADAIGRIDQPTQAFPWGWSVVLPDLPAARRFQALPEYTARIDFVTPTTTVVWGWQGDQSTAVAPRHPSFAGPDLPFSTTSVAVGWDVVLPDLPAFRRNQALPEATGRIDQASGLASASILGWLAELPALRASPPPRVGVLVGPALAPQTVTSVAVGWSIVLPDLRPARRFQALPEATGRIDQATPPVTWGWQADASLPAPRRPRAHQADRRAPTRRTR
jgi:nitrogen fixation protein